MNAGTAPDGSPVEVFRRLPADSAPDYITAAIAPGCDILELGCGAGRMTRALVERGHRVTAVDISPAMLACLEAVAGVQTHLADAVGLDLQRRFGGVVLASYLVNDPVAGAALLATCRRHLAEGGAVVVQRYDPVWARSGSTGAATVGDVDVAVTRLVPAGDRFSATVVYGLEDRRWEQEFEAAIIDDEDLDEMAADAGLVLDRWLDTFRSWARLVAVRTGAGESEPGGGGQAGGSQ